MSIPYQEFLKSKVRLAQQSGFDISLEAISTRIKPHNRLMVQWMVNGGRRACFASFGLHKSVTQLETIRCTLSFTGGKGLIICPLGVRQEFIRDAINILDWAIPPRFIRRIEEVGEEDIYLTNYETIRDGKLDPRVFKAVSLDEASCLRGFGGSKTFREFMRLFTGDGGPLGDRRGTECVPYRFVATATPAPNDYIELLAYADFLGVMDTSQAKTRFFKRDSTKADKLTLHKHKEKEFWLWVASWALFVTKPSDLTGNIADDTGYELPPLDIRWHELSSDHSSAQPEKSGQGRMFKNMACGITDSAREKRESLPARVAKVMELRAEDQDAHRVIWHDLEAERSGLEKAIPDLVTVYGSQELEDREASVAGFSDGLIPEIAAKPVMLGSGCNLQRHCSWAIYMGIGFKFNDFIQSIHRLARFLQKNQVRIDLIYTEAEREIRRQLEVKWQQHNKMVNHMIDIVKEYGLSHQAMAKVLTRKMGVERVEISGSCYKVVNHDAVLEADRLEDNSLGLILTSWPFSTQYEYSPNYADFGHNDGNNDFFEQMDYLTPKLFQKMMPGRIMAVHVKDRIVPGGMNGLGFQTTYPFHLHATAHCIKHGFGYLGMKTIVTDVVRENNQTYRLGWTEQCKDGSKMGVGMPEYLLLFRKPPTDTSRSYADLPVTKTKIRYSRARWQFDAHGFSRSAGDRLLTPEEIKGLDHDAIFKLYSEFSLNTIYDHEHLVRIGEALELAGKLPSDFMLLQPQSWSDDVWTDITRMLTLNGSQHAKGKELHICLATGSRVLTKERGYIPIEDCHVGEHALTHKGRWRRITDVINTGIRATVTLNAHGVPGLTLTPDHKLWTRKGNWVRERDGAEKTEPAWIEAQHTAGGYLNSKLPPQEAGEGDETLWWTVGRWLADGHIDQRDCAIISCGHDKWEEFSSKIGRFGGNTPQMRTAIQLQLCDPGRELRTILEHCGRLANGKHLPPAAFLLPNNLATSLLEGYLSGDGYFLAERSRWTASSISRDLLLGVALLVQRVFGAIATISPGRPKRKAFIEGREVNCQQEWSLSFDVPSTARRIKPFILDDGAWKKVRSISDAGMNETWCIRVVEDESFTAEGCIVKNCPLQLDLVKRVIVQMSNEGDIVLDPFAGVMTVPYMAILEKRYGIGFELNPGYFLDGASYCKAAEQKVNMPTLFNTLETKTT